MINYRLHRLQKQITQRFLKNPSLMQILADYTQMVADSLVDKSAFICVGFAYICVKKYIPRALTQIIFLVSLCLGVFVSWCYAQSISSVELINNAKNYNGNTVVYKGEVIGDIMVRGEYAWINVNDEQNAIGIWIKKELIKDILYTGNYKAKGDLVEITGKFNRACIEHGGDLDIHAQSINKISSGSKIFHAINTRAINFALGLFLTIILICLLRVAIPFDLNQGYQKE